jgi:streptogramin lyase
VWYDESSANAMVGFDPHDAKQLVVRIPTSGATVRNIAADAKRRCLWLALSGTGRIGKLELR